MAVTAVMPLRRTRGARSGRRRATARPSAPAAAAGPGRRPCAAQVPEADRREPLDVDVAADRHAEGDVPLFEPVPRLHQPCAPRARRSSRRRRSRRRRRRRRARRRPRSRADRGRARARGEIAAMSRSVSSGRSRYRTSSVCPRRPSSSSVRVDERREAGAAVRQAGRVDRRATRGGALADARASPCAARSPAPRRPRRTRSRVATSGVGLPGRVVEHEAHGGGGDAARARDILRGRARGGRRRLPSSRSPVSCTGTSAVRDHPRLDSTNSI